jgi:hypothetical protein
MKFNDPWSWGIVWLWTAIYAGFGLAIWGSHYVASMLADWWAL